jgi:hypothetical protein
MYPINRQMIIIRNTIRGLLPTRPRRTAGLSRTLPPRIPSPGCYAVTQQAIRTHLHPIPG